MIGDHARAARRRERVGDAIPTDPRVELRGDVGRILARQHREHFVERRARELMVRIRAPHEIEQRGARPVVVDRRRMATITCASTSSAFCTTRVGSTSPLAHRAQRRRASPSRRRGTSARTRRDSPRRASGRRDRRAAARSATRLGDWSCSTRSTEPMSMPSSSELVLTSARSAPALSDCSSTRRRSRDSEP